MAVNQIRYDATLSVLQINLDRDARTDSPVDLQSVDVSFDPMTDLRL